MKAICSYASVFACRNSIADFEMSRAPETLRRLDGQRIITLDAETTDPEMVARINDAVEDDVLPEIYNKYPSIKTVPLGQAKKTRS